MKRVREKLTYANVVSSLCLILVVGGGTAIAAGELGKESVGTRELAKGAVTPAKLSKAAKKGTPGAPGAPGTPGANGAPGAPGAPGASATALWAAVNNNGSLAGQGPGVVSSVKPQGTNGLYIVTFNRNVSACALIASPREGTGVSVLAEPDAGNANAVRVVPSVNDEVTELDSSFSLGVFC